MTYDDEMLGRYIDGELDGQAAAALETAMTRDPVLADRVADLRMLSMELRGEFASAFSEEVPERLRRAVLTTPSDLRPVRANRSSFFSGWRFPAFLSGATGAAGLALGLVVAPASVLALDENGHLVARGQLAAVLQGGLASEPGAHAVIGVSFKSGDGAWCRSFETRESEAALAGLACSRDGTWRVEIAQATLPSTGDYMQASASMPDAVRDAVAARISGDPLDGSAERAARDGGWK